MGVEPGRWRQKRVSYHSATSSMRAFRCLSRWPILINNNNNNNSYRLLFLGNRRQILKSNKCVHFPGIVETDYLKYMWNHLAGAPVESDRSNGNVPGPLSNLVDLVINGLRLGYSLSSNFVRDGVQSRPPLNVVRSSGESFNSNLGGRSVNGVDSSVGFDTPLSAGDQQAMTSRHRFLVTSLRRVGRPRTFQVILCN